MIKLKVIRPPGWPQPEDMPAFLKEKSERINADGKVVGTLMAKMLHVDHSDGHCIWSAEAGASKRLISLI